MEYLAKLKSELALAIQSMLGYVLHLYLLLIRMNKSIQRRYPEKKCKLFQQISFP